MKPHGALIGPHLQAFFSEHLCNHKRASPQTIASCRDTFRLLLQFLKKTTGIEPAAMKIGDIDVPAVLAFLDNLEQQRGNSVRSRNIRLAAIRSFFRLVALRNPDSIGIATRVLAIPVKREDKKLVGYLTREQMDAILAVPDRTQWSGRRDHALLLTMYNSGARVSEMTSLQRTQVHFGASTFIQLHGKGRKERTVPLWPHTSRVLQAWFHELDGKCGSVAFPNARGRALTRHGVTYLLKEVATAAAISQPSLGAKRITPHLVRHSTAMHLLQSGVDITVIALWLGHESIETTHVYLEADLATKERALAKLTPAEGTVSRFKPVDSVLAFLDSL
jgi:site-specific recombinase XerD